MTREWQFPTAQHGGQVSWGWVLGTDGWWELIYGRDGKVSAMRGPFTDAQRNLVLPPAPARFDGGDPDPIETRYVPGVGLVYATAASMERAVEVATGQYPAAGEDNIGHDGQVLGKVARTQIAVCLIAALVTLAWWPLEVAGLLAAFNGILFAVYTTWRYPDDPAV